MSDINDVTGVTPFDGDLPEDTLSAYLDDELAPEVRAAVELKLESSTEWRAILADVRVARDAVRSLPLVEPPEGFFDALLAEAESSETRDEGASEVVDLEQARARRAKRRNRWIAALGTAAAAAVVVAAVIAPSPARVKPSVASLSNAHALRSSTAEDAVSALASVGKVTGFG